MTDIVIHSIYGFELEDSVFETMSEENKAFFNFSEKDTFDDMINKICIKNDSLSYILLKNAKYVCLAHEIALDSKTAEETALGYLKDSRLLEKGNKAKEFLSEHGVLIPGPYAHIAINYK